MRPRSRRFVAPFTAVLGLVGLIAVLFAGSGHARVQPYYVVKSVGVGKVQPRVLFVVDTSGSMGFRSQAADKDCLWNECEGTGATTQSRMTAARRAIRSIVDSLGTSASFGLMTFDQYSPQPANVVPPKCTGGARFQWATRFKYNVWNTLSHYTGYSGSWRLCDLVNRPYPYLRWNELGVGSVINSDDRVGAVPPSPLISTVKASMMAATNGTRRVQWFPKFMGVRANLNDTTDPDGLILAGTVGDWASTDADRLAQVKGQDFYYWPYVDGFPGYSIYTGDPATPVGAVGITGEDALKNEAQLYAPFYIDFTGTSGHLVSGPKSKTEARDAVLTAMSPMIEGGIDNAGNTPWKSAIGTIPAVPLDSNATYSHTSVASYLKYISTVNTIDVCAPTTVVLVTDGYPTSGEGGAALYQRLAALRKTLDVKVYVVGFFVEGPELNSMACASAGACDGTCTTPCDDKPTAAWDTCATSSAPMSKCAFLAATPEALTSVLTTIVSEALAVDVESGPGASVREFGVGAAGASGEGEVVQTSVRAYTEWPSWRGHVTRAVCTDDDPDHPGQLAPWCVDPPFEVAELAETFGPCPQGRVWDAGVCLQQTVWTSRRLYTHDAANELVPIAEPDGKATAAFRAQLIATGVMTAAQVSATADDFAAFLLGRGWPDGWKLPGLANSAPVVVRRIPKFQPSFTPSVSIRDPHCAGRTLSEVTAAGLPASLEIFANGAWDEDEMLANPSPHHEYQEAVLVGDDLGVLHAFQLDSGNEMWGLLPRFLLASAVAQWHNGAATMGQPSAIEDHRYGIASTLNQGWVYDETVVPPRWRHLGVFGLGAGGAELIALDLSHMSPSSPDKPIEILWTSEDPPLKADYDKWAGETWARPGLTYEVPNNRLAEEPVARLVIGTGYPKVGAGSDAGRTLMYTDAVTGTVLQHAVVGAPKSAFDSTYGTIVDPAVASHCISRFWAEVQEVYVADPAGRIYRWDLGNAHKADSGAGWGTSAQPAVSLSACEGAGSTCAVGTKGDPFVFAPAVTAGGRIDSPGGAASGEAPLGVDQFLLALASGAPSDDKTQADSTFHASLYVLVDDHSTGDPHLGFEVPDGSPKLPPAKLAAYAKYARVAVTDLPRSRTFTPYPGAKTYTDTGTFSRGTRPLRSPKIEVNGVVDAASVGNPQGVEVIDGIEVYTITYTLYEPPSGTCDSRWYNKTKNTWYIDEGATYEVRLRLTAVAGAGFDFTNGASDAVADFGASFGATGLSLQSVTQVSAGECADGSCSPQLGASSSKPCDNNVDPSTGGERGFAMPLYTSTVSGFTPVE